MKSLEMSKESDCTRSLAKDHATLRTDSIELYRSKRRSHVQGILKRSKSTGGLSPSKQSSFEEAGSVFDVNGRPQMTSLHPHPVAATALCNTDDEDEQPIIYLSGCLLTPAPNPYDKAQKIKEANELLEKTETESDFFKKGNRKRKKKKSRRVRFNNIIRLEEDEIIDEALNPCEPNILSFEKPETGPKGVNNVSGNNKEPKHQLVPKDYAVNGVSLNYQNMMDFIQSMVSQLISSKREKDKKLREQNCRNICKSN